jgi:hypothetical protein
MVMDNNSMVTDVIIVAVASPLSLVGLLMTTAPNLVWRTMIELNVALGTPPRTKLKNPPPSTRIIGILMCVLGGVVIAGGVAGIVR